MFLAIRISKAGSSPNLNVAAPHSIIEHTLEMKQIQLRTLLFGLLLFGCNHTNAFCQKQNQTNIPQDTIRPGTKELISLHGPTTSVRTIKQDRKGNIWLASNEGIIRYDGKSFTNITGNLFPNRFFSVLEDRKGNCWFGNYGSGVYYYDGKRLQHFTTGEGLISNWINYVYEDKAGNIWFGTDRGASRYDRKSFRNYTMNADTVIEGKTEKSFSGGS